MKYIVISGGLGNQMFIYAFCEELRARGEKSVLFVKHRPNKQAFGHQGYELKKLFSIRRYDGLLSVLAVFCLTIYSQLLRFFSIKSREKLYRIVGIHIVSVSENFNFYPSIYDFKHKNELFKGTWQSEHFFENVKQNVRKAFVFNVNLLSEKSSAIARLMQNETSVSIHIRRGDYLSEQYINGFAGICTDEYYSNAIKRIEADMNDPHYYIFTDDKVWVLEHFKIKNAIYVTHNKDENSWQDMYLMSQSKHNIIANSSFSWWGAWLNNNPDKIVIAPKLWWRTIDKDDVVPETWLRM